MNTPGQADRWAGELVNTAAGERAEIHPIPADDGQPTSGRYLTGDGEWLRLPTPAETNAYAAGQPMPHGVATPEQVASAHYPVYGEPVDLGSGPSNPGGPPTPPGGPTGPNAPPAAPEGGGSSVLETTGASSVQSSQDDAIGGLHTGGGDGIGDDEQWSPWSDPRRVEEDRNLAPRDYEDWARSPNPRDPRDRALPPHPLSTEIQEDMSDISNADLSSSHDQSPKPAIEDLKADLLSQLVGYTVVSNPPGYEETKRREDFLNQLGIDTDDPDAPSPDALADMHSRFLGTFVHTYPEELVPGWPKGLDKPPAIHLNDGTVLHPDGVDFSTWPYTIYEIKPDTDPDSDARQRVEYVNYMKEQTPGEYQWERRNYNPDEIRERFRQAWQPPAHHGDPAHSAPDQLEADPGAIGQLLLGHDGPFAGTHDLVADPEWDHSPLDGDPDLPSEPPDDDLLD